MWRCTRLNEWINHTLVLYWHICSRDVFNNIKAPLHFNHLNDFFFICYFDLILIIVRWATCKIFNKIPFFIFKTISIFSTKNLWQWRYLISISWRKHCMPESFINSVHIHKNRFDCNLFNGSFVYFNFHSINCSSWKRN